MTSLRIHAFSFDLRLWRVKYIRRSDNTMYIHENNGVYYTYSVDEDRLAAIGRLINLSADRNRVNNIDSLYEGMSGIHIFQDDYEDAEGTHTRYRTQAYTQDLENLINYINTDLYNLLGIDVDIRTFRVTHIEICFNIHTPYVGEYIAMFNRTFKKRQLSNYTSYVEAMNEPEYSSYYVKGNSQFEDDEERGYIVNFYNKWHQLGRLIEKQRHIDSPDVFGDITLAQNILRLEVKVAYNALTKLCGDFNITRDFQNFLDPRLCREIIVRRYRYLIMYEMADFHSLEHAIPIIRNSISPRYGRNIIQYLTDDMRNRAHVADGTIRGYRRALRDIEVHWCLIPSRLGVDFLESPITMLDRLIVQIEENRDNADIRAMEAQLTEDLSAAIAEEDDGTVIVVEEE